VEGEEAASVEATGEPAASPAPIRDGSSVRLSSYSMGITNENVASLRVDPATGELVLGGVELPVVELPLGQFFEFEPTGAAGRVNALGEADLVLPVEMRDEEGNPTRVEITLTTGTAATLGDDGRYLTFTGEPLDAQGDGTLVGLVTLPSGGLEGALMRIVLNVHVEP
jgi:hypothetical protein